MLTLGLIDCLMVPDYSMRLPSLSRELASQDASTCKSFGLASLSYAYIVYSRTIQTAVLIETLTALGAEVTWSSCVCDISTDSLIPELKEHTEHLLHPRSCCSCVRLP
jgi:hypothetical protein